MSAIIGDVAVVLTELPLTVSETPDATVFFEFVDADSLWEFL